MTSIRSLSLLLPLALLLQVGLLSAQTATVSGYVRDASSGEGMPGANVFLTGTSFGAATNSDGYFVLTSLDPGNYTLLVSYLGFASVTHDLSLQPEEELRIDVELFEQAVMLEEVKVSGQRLDRQINSQISRVKLSTRQLGSLPKLGEADLMRTLQALPGVLTTSELSTGLVIRGGNTDQNLILLDCVTVYNPSHLGGLFSNFIIDAIQEADLIKGGFNAEYGDRLSAVLNVRSREGNRKRFKGKGSVSLLAAQTTLEGPVGRGAWLASFRRTYFDKLFKGTDFFFPYFFYDIQGHIFQDLTDRDRLSVSWYLGRDDLDFDAFGLNADWGNATYSVNYRKLLSARLVTNTLVASSRFDTFFALGADEEIAQSSVVDDRSFRTDWTYFGANRRQLRWGLEAKQLLFTYDATILDSALFTVSQKPVEVALYQKSKLWLGDNIMIEPGLRVTYYNLHPQKWFFDPRLNVKITIAPDQYINLAAGFYHQFMATVQDDYNPTILDNWVAVDGSIDPGSSSQWVAGYESYFGGRYRFQAEVYYKSLDNLLTFRETRSTSDQGLPGDFLADQFISGSGTAYGAELFLQREVGRLTGWLAYAMSVSQKNLLGKEYYTNWDRRHVFNVVAAFRPNSKWDLSLKWTYQSGQPYTPILGYYYDNLTGATEATFIPIPGGRNSLRLPEYHRLDLGLGYHLKKRRGMEMEVSFQVVNAYWRKNVFAYYYVTGSTSNGLDDDDDGEIDEPDEAIPQRETLSIFPLLPSIGISIAF